VTLLHQVHHMVVVVVARVVAVAVVATSEMQADNKTLVGLVATWEEQVATAGKCKVEEVAEVAVAGVILVEVLHEATKGASEVA